MGNWRNCMVAGSFVFFRGDPPDGLYAVLSGSVLIGSSNALGKAAVLARLGAGQQPLLTALRVTRVAVTVAIALVLVGALWRAPMRWLHGALMGLGVALSCGAAFAVYAYKVFGVPHGELSDFQLEWLEQKLAEVPERYTLLLLHHHPMPSGCSWLDQHSLRNAGALDCALGQNHHHCHRTGADWHRYQNISRTFILAIKS